MAFASINRTTHCRVYRQHAHRRRPSTALHIGCCRCTVLCLQSPSADRYHPRASAPRACVGLQPHGTPPLQASGSTGHGKHTYTSCSNITVCSCIHVYAFANVRPLALHSSWIRPGSTWEKAGAMLPAGDTGARTCDRSGIGIKRPPVGYSAEKASTSGTADAVSTSTNHAAFIISAAEKEKRILRGCKSPPVLTRRR